MIYFIFPHDLARGGVAFWGNQALTVGALLWLHCLHCSAVDMLKWEGGGVLSRSGQYLDLQWSVVERDGSTGAKTAWKNRITRG